MKKIRLKINGREIEATPGKTILEVVRENGLDDIPTLCHSPELEPYGSCFVCVVEVKGGKNLVPACATRITPDMEVETRNRRIIASRKTALELLMSNHYADCVSPCMEGCPAGVDAQGYIALSAMGQYRKAVDLIREANPLPAVCGRVCVRKCEEVCRREDIDTSVAINNIKRFVSDSPDAYATEPKVEPDTGKTVGIIGSGPAGLTAAWFLARRGIKPVIYEMNRKAGGMLRYGIPEYRLPDRVLDKEIDYICKTGVEVKCGVKVGRDVTLKQLREKHDAIFIGPGAWTGKSMRVEGEFDTEGVVTGAEFLVEKAENPKPVSGTVVVVGGGNTAMDAARTSWRLNADKVIILYRRTKAEMPADPMEIKDCLEEGIEIMELAAPVAIVKENGKLKALKCQRMKLGEPDASGRRRPVPIEGSEFELPCDLVISAIGQNTVLDGLVQVNGDKLELTRWNTYVIDPETMQTNVEGIFAGGDAADDGPTVAIDAIRDGRKAADSITAWLLGEKLPRKPFAVRKDFWAKPGRMELGDVKESPRHELHTIDVEQRRNSFAEVATGFEPEDNEHECSRCLSCGCVRFDDCKLRLYAEEYEVDMEHFKGYARKHRVDDRHPYIIYDPNKCILCARCIKTCGKILPISALGLINRGFRTEMRPAMNDPLVATSCVSCGNCVEACPTAALTVKYPFPGRASLKTVDVRTHCGFCSVGCETTVKAFGPGRYYITSSGEPGAYLCRYGRFGQELFVKSERIVTPAKREGASHVEIGFDEAYGVVAENLREIAAKYGPESVAVFVSPELTNEESYLAGRIAREGIGTANVGSLSIISGSGRSGALDEILGFTASTASRECLKEADLIICNNTSLEEDHLVLAVDVLQAVREGARLVVANSVVDTVDEKISALTVDPMRGRASLFWNAVTRVLVDDGDVNPSAVRGGEKFTEGRVASVEDAAREAGVAVARVHEVAELLKYSDSIVLVHSPDRARDASPGDLEILADLAVLLRSAGKTVNLLLPRLFSNSAGLEVMGADPAFLFGRVPVNGELPGASSNLELRRILENGELRAALVIGEDPLEYNRSGSWFRNLEFLAAMDWTNTETTRSADVVLPGSTYFETRGTRCNFEGRVLEYTRAVEPPSGMDGVGVLRGMASAFGVDADMKNIDAMVRNSLGDLAAFYWNTGQTRDWSDPGRFVPVSTEVKALPIQPPMTRTHEYRMESREIGLDRFKVI